MIKSSVIYRNTKNLDADTSLMDAAMEAAFFMEELGILAYRNWDKGELVAGPYVTRFHTTVTFMFSIKVLPDLLALDRLKNMDCLVSVAKDVYERIVKEKMDNELDYEFKKIKHNVILITIKIPNRYLALDGNTIMNIDGEDVYYDDIDVIYDGDLTTDGAESTSDGGFGDSGGDDFSGFDDGDMEL